MNRFTCASSGKRGKLVSIALLALACGFHGLESSAAGRVIGFGAGQPGTQNYETNRALAALLKRGSVRLRLESYGGPSTALALLDQGELDFTAVVSSDLHDAVMGRGTFSGSELSNLRIVTTLVTSRIGMFVSSRSNIQTVADLSGRTLAYGFSSQPSLTTMVDGVLASAGLGISDVETELVASVLDGADRLAAGRVDAALLAIGAGKLIEIDSLLGGVRLLPIGQDAASLAALQRVSPTATVETVFPGPATIGVIEPTPLLAYHYVLVTHSQADDDTVTSTLEMIWTNVEALRSDSYVLSGLTQAHMGTDHTWEIPTHPAALAFFGER